MTSGHGFYISSVYEFGFITLNICSLLEQFVHWSQTANQKRNSRPSKTSCWLTLPKLILFDHWFFSKTVFLTIWICLNIWWYILQGAKSFVACLPNLPNVYLSHHIVVIHMSDKPPAGTKSFVLNMVPEVCPVPGNLEPHAFSYFYVYVYTYTYTYI